MHMIVVILHSQNLLSQSIFFKAEKHKDVEMLAFAGAGNSKLPHAPVSGLQSLVTSGFS
jgi:hypothetical protein